MSKFKKGDRVKFITHKHTANSSFFEKGLTGLTICCEVVGGYAVYESDKSNWWLVREGEVEKETLSNRIGGKLL